jgi:hypothetical protein
MLCQSGLALALEPPETTEPVPTTHSALADQQKKLTPDTSIGQGRMTILSILVTHTGRTTLKVDSGIGAPLTPGQTGGLAETLLKMMDWRAGRSVTGRHETVRAPPSRSSRRSRPRKPRGAWGESDPCESPGSTFTPAAHHQVSGIQEGLWWIGPRLHRILGESETGHSTWSDLGDTYKPRSPPQKFLPHFAA